MWCQQRASSVSVGMMPQSLVCRWLALCPTVCSQQHGVIPLQFHMSLTPRSISAMVSTRFVNTMLDWFMLNGLFHSQSCITIDNCGLDYTGENIMQQHGAFWMQVQAAKLLGNLLILHLQGGRHENVTVTEESIYEEAFFILMEELPQAHSIYLHC